MATVKKTSSQTPMDYASWVVRDARLLPLELLRCYGELDLTERELIPLARLICLCYSRGSMTMAQVMEEFRADEDEALAILRPYLDRRLLEYDKNTDAYGCEGLRRELYLLWVSRTREEPQQFTDLTGLSPWKTEDEREQARALSHLYRRFEQELGRTLRPTENDRLRIWVADDCFAPELIEEALGRAVLHDKCTMAYIESILKNWRKKGLTSVAMVLELDKPPEKAAAQTSEVRVKKSAKSKYDKVEIN